MISSRLRERRRSIGNDGAPARVAPTSSARAWPTLSFALNSVLRSVQQVVYDASRLPWLTFVFLAAVFVACNHELLAAAKVTESNVSTAMAAIAEGSLARRIALFALAAWGAVVLWRRGVSTFQGPVAWFTVAFLILASASVFWSADRAITVRRLMVLFTFGLGAVAVARRLSVKEMALFVVLSGTAFFAIGVVVELALGTFAPLSADYRFSGTLHPNHQGINAAMVVLSSLYLARAGRKHRTLFMLLAAVGFGFLLLTRSRTALGALIAALLVFWLLASPRLGKIVLAATAALLLSGVLVLHAVNDDPTHALLLERTDSNVETLTGRTSLWHVLDSYVAEKPLLGYGFNTFWTPDRVEEMSAGQYWTVFEAHSTYLEMLLSLGMAGLALYLLLLATAIVRAVQLERWLHRGDHALLAALLTFVAVEGLLESALVAPTAIAFLAIIAFGHVAQAPRRLRATPDWERSAATRVGRYRPLVPNRPIVMPTPIRNGRLQAARGRRV